MSGILYFGYGAMVNPVSRERRKVETCMTKPAVLEDYRLTFAYGGAGNVLKQRGWSVHGVLMECATEKDWQLLVDFDAGYDCIEVDIYPYGDENPVKANIFVMAGDEEDNAKLPAERLPQERYVRIIAQGMRYHGVDEEYIDYQIMNVPYIPNRKPEDYLQFPNPNKKKKKVKAITDQEYQKRAAKEMWFKIGNRVIAIGPHDPNSAFVKWAVSQVIGKGGLDSVWTILQTLYDPDLPICESKEDIKQLHIAWAENQMVEKFDQADLKGAMCVHVTRERDSGPSSAIIAVRATFFCNPFSTWTTTKAERDKSGKRKPSSDQLVEKGATAQSSTSNSTDYDA